MFRYNDENITANNVEENLFEEFMEAAEETSLTVSGTETLGVLRNLSTQTDNGVQANYLLQ